MDSSSKEFIHILRKQSRKGAQTLLKAREIVRQRLKQVQKSLQKCRTKVDVLLKIKQGYIDAKEMQLFSQISKDDTRIEIQFTDRAISSNFNKIFYKKQNYPIFSRIQNLFKDKPTVLCICGGMSGSGKSYTLFGNSGNPGLLDHFARKFRGRNFGLSSIQIPLVKKSYPQLSDSAEQDWIKFKGNNTIADFSQFQKEKYKIINARKILNTVFNQQSSRTIQIIRIVGQDKQIVFFDLPGQQKGAFQQKEVQNAIQSIWSETTLTLGLLNKGQKFSTISNGYFKDKRYWSYFYSHLLKPNTQMIVLLHVTLSMALEIQAKEKNSIRSFGSMFVQPKKI